MIVLVIFFSILSLYIYAKYIEPSCLEQKHFVIPYKQGDGSQVGTLSLLHLSDFHFGTYPARDLKIIEQIKKLPHADLLCLTGDYIESPEGLLSMEILFRDFNFPYGIYAVRGNNDGKYGKALLYLFDKYDVCLLNNESYTINFGTSITLSGVDDPHHYKDTHISPGTDVGIKILLAHSSEIFSNHEYKSVPYDIILTGHTHGGQISIPFIGPLFYNSRMGRKWIRGIFKENDKNFVISRGLGTTALPLRFLSYPEAIFIHINLVKNAAPE